MVISSVETHRRSLPIYAHREHIQNFIQSHKCVVIVGEPGSGKTTQIPQYLRETGVSYCLPDHATDVSVRHEGLLMMGSLDVRSLAVSLPSLWHGGSLWR